MRFLMTFLFTVATILGVAGCVTTAKTSDLTPEQKTYHDAVMAFPTEFKVPKADAETAWARGISFINDYSSMQIASSTEYSVATFAPINVGENDIATKFGYTLSRIPQGEEVTFKAEGQCNYSAEAGLSNAKILAYYMKTGELDPFFVNKVIKTK